mmetsp:Transcript_12793/g.11341  ORF Transcript_12793/g.11341 Transcript_12793/m.11341 type:complete len:138 (-) Transcript_12793:57-470(-)
MSWRPQNDGDVDAFKMMRNKTNAQVILLYIFKHKKKQYKTVTTVSSKAKDDNWNTPTEKSQDNADPDFDIQNNLNTIVPKNDRKIHPLQSTINLETIVDSRLFEESKGEDLNKNRFEEMKQDLNIPKKSPQVQEEEI